MAAPRWVRVYRRDVLVYAADLRDLRISAGTGWRWAVKQDVTKTTC